MIINILKLQYLIEYFINEKTFRDRGLSLLWCGNAYADKYFLKSIDNLNSNLETTNSFDVIFYVSSISSID